MQRWISFGASEIGPAHIATGKPNQDSWAAFHHFNCDVLVVSDGMGSKDFSEFGSAAACKAVDHAVCSGMLSGASLDLNDPGSRELFLNGIRDCWLKDILPLTSDQASATCLFAFRANGTIWIGMLGDGCAACVLADGSPKLLQDPKDESFSNMTKSLSEKVTPDEWRLMGVSEKKCKAVLLCTDGIADDLTDPEGFVAGYVESVIDLPVITAAGNASSMLIDWPTPKHSDDKTIACLIRRDYGDE